GEGYLKGLRELTAAHNILLILDETVTGFRVAPGGCQELYGIQADIATFGKALGAGFPVAAFVGRADVMEALSWGGVLHYGTQNASRIGLVAARASLEELTRENNAGFSHLRRIGEQLCSGLREVFAQKGVPAIVQNVGPMFQIMFTEHEAIRDYREFCAHVDRAKFQRFALGLFEKGVYISPSAALHSVVSLAHTEEDVAFTLDAVRSSL
ncbi:MAG: aminotransferase class III-fold pyridoxal phosphate-dependent enzyme, partial [Candidatus Aminicenantales bacterium]